MTSINKILFELVQMGCRSDKRNQNQTRDETLPMLCAGQRLSSDNHLQLGRSPATVVQGCRRARPRTACRTGGGRAPQANWTRC